MSDSFHDRGKSFEAHQKQETEMRFKAHSRRNKLVGLWAAELMGLTGGDAEAYAKTIVIVDFDEPGDEDVVRKIMADFAEHGVATTVEELRAELLRQMAVATEQLNKEYPEALSDDHG